MILTILFFPSSEFLPKKINNYVESRIKEMAGVGEEKEEPSDDEGSNENPNKNHEEPNDQ